MLVITHCFQITLGNTMRFALFLLANACLASALFNPLTPLCFPCKTIMGQMKDGYGAKVADTGITLLVQVSVCWCWWCNVVKFNMTDLKKVKIQKLGF